MPESTTSIQQRRQLELRTFVNSAYAMPPSSRELLRSKMIFI